MRGQRPAGAGEEEAAEFERREAEDAAPGDVRGLGLQAFAGGAVVVEGDGGQDDVAELPEGGAGEGGLGVEGAAKPGGALGEEAGAQGLGRGLALLGRVAGAAGVLDEHERDGEAANALETDLVDRVMDRGEGRDVGFVVDGVGDREQTGEDGGILLDQFRDLRDGDLAQVRGERLDQLEQFRQAGAAARLHDRAGAVEGLGGREGIGHSPQYRPAGQRIEGCLEQGRNHGSGGPCHEGRTGARAPRLQ